MIKKRYLILILCIIAILSMQFVSANDNTDDINVLGASEDGNVLQAPSETQSYTDLNTIINQAGEGDEINLTYNYEYRYGNDPKTGINITKNIVINGNGATIDGKSASSLFNISEGVTVTLKNLTITQAAGIQNNGQEWYRAITSGSGTTLNIVDCTFDSNKAGEEWQYSSNHFYGSAIYSLGNVNIQNSNFINNIVQTAGVIYTGGTITAKNTKFSNNRAINRQQVDEYGDHMSTEGGAIFAGYVDNIENCTFESNFADVGGSIYSISGIGRVSNSSFNGTGVNQGSNQKVLNGAAITSLWGAISLIENSNFTDFTSATDGGAIYMIPFGGSDTTKIVNSTFMRNYLFSNVQSDTCLGGAIFTGGNLEIENVTLEKNYAKKGGAVYAEGSVTVSDSQISGNGRSEHPATEQGGAIYAKNNINIENTTFGVNYAQTAGGAVYSERNVNFYNSKANGSADTTGGSGKGGFIYAKGNINVENSTVAAINVANAVHATSAVYTEGNIVVRNSTFTKIQNKNFGIDGARGGAIRAEGNAEIYSSNFTDNIANYYGAVYIEGTLDVYDSNFINNTQGNAFSEGRAVVNNTNFMNITCSATNLRGVVIGSNSTLSFTNSLVNGTHVSGSQHRGLVFSEDNLFVENSTLSHNFAEAGGSTGMILSTNSNVTASNCDFHNNSFTSQNCMGGNIYAGYNANVKNCSFEDSTVIGKSGNTHGVVVYAEENITFVDSFVEDVHSANSDQGAITGNYVYVHNSTIRNLTGFTAMGVGIHANVANVSDCNFTLVRSEDNADCGGAIYANNTYAYRNNFTFCHSGHGGAIYSLNYTTAIENIFINNTVTYNSGCAIYTKNGFIEYNVFLDNKNSNHPEWGGTLADMEFLDANADSIERNWWGNNTPFEGEKGKKAGQRR